MAERRCASELAKAKTFAPGGYDLLKQDIPELAVVAGAVVALGVDIDAEAGGIHFEQAGELAYVVVVVFVISLVEILFVARARVFAWVVDDRRPPSASTFFIGVS